MVTNNPCLLVLIPLYISLCHWTWLICVTERRQRRWWCWVLRLHHERKWHFCLAFFLLFTLKGVMGDTWTALWRGSHGKELRPLTNLSDMRAGSRSCSPANILTTFQNSWLTEIVRNNEYCWLNSLSLEVICYTAIKETNNQQGKKRDTSQCSVSCKWYINGRTGSSVRATGQQKLWLSP